MHSGGRRVRRGRFGGGTGVPGLDFGVDRGVRVEFGGPESERQASLTTKAVHTACEDLSSTSVDVVNAVNAYVDAANNRPGDVPATTGPAIAALNRSADLVSADVNDALPADLRGMLTEWVDAARGVVGAINDGGVDAFNTAKNRLNTAKENALRRCDTAY